jgi:hypothetical protein
VAVGQQDEPAVLSREMAAGSQLGLGPAQPLFAGPEMKGGGAPAQQEQPAALVLGHVAELGADQLGVLEIVMSDDELIPSVLLVRLDPAYLEVVEHVLLGDLGQTQWLRHGKQCSGRGRGCFVRSDTSCVYRTVRRLLEFVLPSG